MSTMLRKWDVAQLDSTLSSLLNVVSQAFRMDREEAARFAASPIARLIGALPYLAGCDRAERTAVEHLGTYVLSVRETRSAFYATTDDDATVYDRLAPIMHFEGGDEALLRRGIALLALSMITDYKRDVDLDRMIGKHNPIGSGAWDFESTREELQRDIDAVDSPDMDHVFRNDASVENWWAW